MTDNTDTKEKLTHAYNYMMEHVKQAIDTTEKEAGPVLHALLDMAKDKAVALEHVTREEAEKIGGYLKRDIEDAAEYMASPEAEELAAWFKFDVSLIEDRILEAFTSVADKTKLEMMAFEEGLIRTSEYHTGEITGIGTLYCKNCNQHIHFHKTSHIPPCPKCHETVFTRQVTRNLTHQ